MWSMHPKIQSKFLSSFLFYKKKKKKKKKNFN